MKRTIFVLALSFMMAFGTAVPTSSGSLGPKFYHQSKGEKVCVQLVGQQDWVCIQ